MMIETINVGTGKRNHPRYFLYDGKHEIAYFDELTTAAIVVRFLRGSKLTDEDYQAAKAAMAQWDERHAPDPEGIS